MEAEGVSGAREEELETEAPPGQWEWRGDQLYSAPEKQPCPCTTGLGSSL